MPHSNNEPSLSDILEEFLASLFEDAPDTKKCRRLHRDDE